MKTLVSAAALANARAFGGQDYTGYHTFMALVPAYQMAGELPAERQALPVLKVLYRNSSRIQEQHAGQHDMLHQVECGEPNRLDCRWRRIAPRCGSRRRLGRRRSAVRGNCRGPASEAFNQLQLAVQDEVNVHRVVLAWRAWAMLELAGEQYAHTLLRQSRSILRRLGTDRCATHKHPTPEVRQALPRLLDEYHLVGKPLGNRQATMLAFEQLAQAIFSGTREQAAEAAAAALAEGMDPEAVGEAISMAANLLVLHDPGRRPENSTPQKPAGCVHGDSIGVHASDAANAWRNIARVSNPRNEVASLIVGAYHTAGQFGVRNEGPISLCAICWTKLKPRMPPTLLGQAEEAIRGKDQARACAVVHRYGELKLPERPVFDLLLKYAVSEDGALHAEKYYRTVSEEFASNSAGLSLAANGRAGPRHRQRIRLPGPGFQEACELLGV